MNYLSHYYFDQQNTDPYYILGIALPDLSKTHNRRWNIHPHKFTEEYAKSPVFTSIQKGWERHLVVDHFFHESSFFKEKTTLITERIRSLSLDNKKVKPFMLGHIGLEIMLDTLLLKNNNIDGLKFYEHLKSCKMPDIIDFLSISDIPEAHTFEASYNRFTEVQYLLSYQSNESIVYALNRIQYRLTQEFFSENDVRLMHHHIAELMEIVEKDYLSIFDDIHAHLENEK